MQTPYAFHEKCPVSGGERDHDSAVAVETAPVEKRRTKKRGMPWTSCRWCKFVVTIGYNQLGHTWCLTDCTCLDKVLDTYTLSSRLVSMYAFHHPPTHPSVHPPSIYPYSQTIRWNNYSNRKRSTLHTLTTTNNVQQLNIHCMYYYIQQDRNQRRNAVDD